MEAYLLYLAGIILLTLPSGILARKYLKVATVAELTDRAQYRRGLLHPLNAIDLARAYAGMHLLLAGFIAYEPLSGEHLVTKVVLAAGALLGLVLQHAFHYTADDELPVPLAFAFGLTLAVLPAKVALLVLPLGIATAIAVRNLGVGLAFATVATAILGHLLGLGLPTIGTACLLLFLPVLASGIFHRRLVLTIRRGPILRAAAYRDVPLPNHR
jgi:hypothetical protein